MRSVGRLEHTRLLKRDVCPGDSVEEALAGSEQDGRDRQGELVDEIGAQVLAEQVGAVHDDHVLVAGCGAGAFEASVMPPVTNSKVVSPLTRTRA